VRDNKCSSCLRKDIIPRICELHLLCTLVLFLDYCIFWKQPRHNQNLIVFWRPFVKRFALCYQTVVCPVLSVTLVYCGQTVERIKMKLGTQVGLGPGHIVLDGDPAPPPPKGGQSPQFLAHICCGQMAAGIKMPLGMEVWYSAQATLR